MSIFNNENKVEWFTRVFAPRFYDVYLLTGENFWFYEKNPKSGYGFTATPGGGWREAGVIAAGGAPDRRVNLPYGVHLLWMSRTEKKYYQAEIILPREKMLVEMAKKFDFEWSDKRKDSNFSTIDVALAPGGFVSLRLGGTRTLEVATVQAKSVEVNWDFFARSNHFNPDTYPEEEFNHDHYEKLPEYIQKQVKEKTFPLDRWKNYSDKKFPWSFASKIELEGCRLAHVNGDDCFFNKAALKEIAVNSLRPVPSNLVLYYRMNGKRWQANLRFTKQKRGGNELPEDDLEVFNTFIMFFSSKLLPTVFAIEYSEDRFKAFLINGLKKQEVKIYQSEIWNVDQKFDWY